MATYKGIQGYSVQKLSSDPTVADTVGQLWYNSTTGKFKISTQGAGAWSSGGTMNTARYRTDGGFGTLTAGTVVAGYSTPIPGVTANTEEYDGTTWTEVNNVPTATADPSSTGTQTAGLHAVGAPASDGTTREYDGTSWAVSGTRLFTTSGRAKLFGIQTAAVTIGGASPGGYLTTVNEYDGTSWTAATAYPAGYGNGGCSGTLTAGFAFAGIPGEVVESYTYDGTNWTEANDLNTGRGECGFSIAGTQAASQIVAGEPANNVTETFDGTSWSTSPATLATARSQGASIGTAASGVYAGGGSAPTQLATEEWADPVYAIKTVTVS
jgi:hypothetical protein